MSDVHGDISEAEAEKQDPKTADGGSDDEEEEDDAGGVSDGAQDESGGESKEGRGEGMSGTGKKKKKKQKKRKKKGTGGGSSDNASSGSASPGASPPTSPSANSAASAPSFPAPSADAPVSQPSLDDMLPVEIAEKRFAAALESMRSKADLCMWVQLARCRVGDKKLRRLTDALIHCDTVTSVDLSGNLISDTGLRQLACALSAPSAAPDLISLNVKQNPISASGRACLANLQAVRKLVRIEYEDNPPAAAAGAGERKGGQGGAGQAMVDARGFEGGERMGGGSKASNPQIRIDAAVRFIREASEKLQHLTEGDNSTPGTTTAAAASSVVTSTRVFDSAMMTEALEDVVELVDSDLRRNPTKSYHNSPISKLPLPLRLVVENLPTFAALLEMPLPPQPCQRKHLEPAAGRHRILAVLLLRKVLGACGRAVDDRMSREGVGRKVAALLFQFPWSNVLHHSACCFLTSALERPNSSLSSSLLEPPPSDDFSSSSSSSTLTTLAAATSLPSVSLPASSVPAATATTTTTGSTNSSSTTTDSTTATAEAAAAAADTDAATTAPAADSTSSSSSPPSPPSTTPASASSGAGGDEGAVRKARGSGQGEGEADPRPQVEAEPEAKRGRVNGEQGEGAEGEGAEGEGGEGEGAEGEGVESAADAGEGGEGGEGGEEVNPSMDADSLSTDSGVVTDGSPNSWTASIEDEREKSRSSEGKGQEEEGKEGVDGQGAREGESEGGKQAAAAAASAASSEVLAGPLALPVWLAVTAAPWINTPMGRRPGHAGPIIQLMSDIRGRATTSAPLQAKLEKLPEWRAFVEPGGPLDDLLAQQQGALCGPKPVVPGSDSSAMGGSGGQSMLFGEPDLPPSVLGKLRAIYLQ